MTLAHIYPDDPTTWGAYVCVIALYALARRLFVRRRDRHEGTEHAGRVPLPGENGPSAVAWGAFRSYRQFVGYAGSAVVVALVLTTTGGTLRLVLVCTVVPLLVVALAFLDVRLEGKGRRPA
ncbi:hypothetical protein [Streptomyces sp. enrichment culture]|uniref:hypothetical protein n=1 Tax=Streptomyces sp. enrichment culture TaxID=1795815 RepID=UPI003F57EA3F